MCRESEYSVAGKAGGRRLVIVESPTKANKIASFLGDGYIVQSSRGHIRDLPTGAAEVPAKYKGEKWARTGVNVDNGFEAIYVVSPEKRATLRTLKEALVGADELLLATDGDREGEAIAWHLLQELKPKVPAKRMVFHEITPTAIAEAVANPRDLDEDLVDAQETRRILDRLYGYEVSPVLWKKVMPRLSAGRVQSVATRLIVDRERERIAFRSASYWDLDAILDAGSDAQPPLFPARLTRVGERRVAQGRDFDSRGSLIVKDHDQLIRLDEAQAQALADSLRSAAFAVDSVESKPYTRRPYAPFRTTTLQQEAGRKLGFTAQRTMSIAQDLYEAGFITYMRTDSITLSGTAIAAARQQVQQLYGADYLPDQPRVYTSRVKNAQEAHEAIRPAGETFLTPAQTRLSGDQFRLYELIWMRTIASQMKDAEGLSITVKINAQPSDGEPCVFVASGRTITFYGFLKAYVESVEETDGHTDDEQTRLPRLTAGQQLRPESVTASGHETRPPSRYTEPSLVAKLEELEIGRPSTYATIIRTITARDYVFKKGTALVPTWLAFAVTRLLEEHFPRLVDYAFTAEMEDVLDEIADGHAERLRVLTDFYFGDDNREGLHRLVTELGEIDARKLSTFEIADPDALATGAPKVVVRVGRYGTYVEDEEGRRANVADDLPPDELTIDLARELLAKPVGEERELGLDPETSRMIVAKNGRFGPYVTEILARRQPQECQAAHGIAALFDEPRLGRPRPSARADESASGRRQGRGRCRDHRTERPVRALLEEGLGLPLLGERRSDLFDHLAGSRGDLRPTQAARPGCRQATAQGTGCGSGIGRPMIIKEGRFGAYVTDGEVNATLRRGDDVETITAERAAELLAEKRAKGPTPKKRPAKRTQAAAAEAAAPKPAAKRVAAKKVRAKAG